MYMLKSKSYYIRYIIWGTCILCAACTYHHHPQANDLNGNRKNWQMAHKVNCIAYNSDTIRCFKVRARIENTYLFLVLSQFTFFFFIYSRYDMA